MPAAVLPPPAAPVGWYVHLPFCTTKCGYCDFYSLPTQPERIPDLVRALLAELELRNPRRPVQTLFVGGGTPTVLPAEPLQTLLRALFARIDPADRAALEFTCEANPSSADELKLDLLRDAGVNRVSFGAQSFDENDLRVLERLHDPRHIAEAVALARRAGFDNVSLDLIFGVPGQTLERWLRTLARAVELQPDHLACYGLMYEEGTALTRQRRLGAVAPIDEELEADMFLATRETLTAAGYQQYEISNYARPGRECRHNLIYWNNDEYLGVGPSAVSYLAGVRTKNRPDVRTYIAAWTANPPDGEALVIERESLAPRARAGETAVQMLRMTCGIDRAGFRARCGQDPEERFADAIATHRAAGLLEVDAAGVRLTSRGQLLANRVMVDFL
ncbi:MAG: radical SAM family heme chaperone HemW [Phycisphaerae bacterium]